MTKAVWVREAKANRQVDVRQPPGLQHQFELELRLVVGGVQEDSYAHRSKRLGLILLLEEYSPGFIVSTECSADEDLLKAVRALIELGEHDTRR